MNQPSPSETDWADWDELDTGANGFSGAAGMRDLVAVEPEPEPAPVVQELEARQPHLVVERLTAEGVVMDFVLCEHDIPQAAQVAEAVRSYGYVIFEEVGIASVADRQAIGREYTELVADDVDPAWREQVIADDPKSWPVQVLSHLPGTNQEVLVLDLTQDDPRYEAEAARESGYDSYYATLNALLLGQYTSSEEMLRRKQELFALDTAADKVREDVMAEGIVKIVQHAQKNGMAVDPLECGYVLGYFHADVIDLAQAKLAEAGIEVQLPAQSARRIGTENDYEYYIQARTTAMRDGKEVPDELLSRLYAGELLFTFRHRSPDDNNEIRPLYREVVARLSDEQITDLLAEADEVLSSSVSDVGGLRLRRKFGERLRALGLEDAWRRSTSLRGGAS